MEQGEKETLRERVRRIRMKLAKADIERRQNLYKGDKEHGGEQNGNAK